MRIRPIDGFTTDDVIFKWKKVDPVQVTADLHLPRFALEQFTTDYCDSMTNTGKFLILLAKSNTLLTKYW